VVLDRGGDWLFALKANRPAMLREVEAFFADPPTPLEAFETNDADERPGIWLEDRFQGGLLR
jgi:hypothetical protein